MDFFYLTGWSYLCRVICNILLPKLFGHQIISTLLQVSAIDLVTIAVDFLPLAVEFGTFAVEFVVLALQFVTLAMELEAFAMGLGAFICFRISRCLHWNSGIRYSKIDQLE